ncbi:MAG TPA: RNA degradosome polyphosphate kinase, partial [Lachnospiraceae bacterium]|nr:RNA degradosome polyphosphate kinase [Lachnospiraceae bacterium]
KKDIAGMTPLEQLAAINIQTHQFVKDQYNIYNSEVIPGLLDNGIKIISYYEDLNEDQSAYIDEFFQSEVLPVLTPMAVDSSRPFPLIRNKTLNIGAVIKVKTGSDKNNNAQFRELYMSHYNKKKNSIDTGDIDFATVQVPSVLPRFVEIPSSGNIQKTFILLEQII